MLGYACALEVGGRERTLVWEHGGTRQGGIELAAAAKRWIDIYYALDQSACAGAYTAKGVKAGVLVESRIGSVGGL